jgi:hypothetical protein
MYYRYLLSILVTYVRKSTPELEKALLLVRSLRGKFKLHFFTLYLVIIGYHYIDACATLRFPNEIKTDISE